MKNTWGCFVDVYNIYRKGLLLLPQEGMANRPHQTPGHLLAHSRVADVSRFAGWNPERSLRCLGHSVFPFGKVIHILLVFCECSYLSFLLICRSTSRFYINHPISFCFCHLTFCAFGVFVFEVFKMFFPHLRITKIFSHNFFFY